MAARSRVTPIACRMLNKYTRCERSRPERSLRRPFRRGWPTEHAASWLSLPVPDRTAAPADRQSAVTRDQWTARILRSPLRISRPSAGGASWRTLPAHQWTADAIDRRVAPMRDQRPMVRSTGTPRLSLQRWRPRRGYDGRRSATCGSRCGPALRVRIDLVTARSIACSPACGGRVKATITSRCWTGYWAAYWGRSRPAPGSKAQKSQ
jgi:hypothetical protein